MQERIKALRKALNLTQAKFAEKLGVKPNTISQYESGRNEPIDAVVSLICREFNVSEKWLRTGEGEMEVKRSREDELAEFMDQLLQSEPDDIRRRFVSAISRLSTRELEVLEKAAMSLVAETPKRAEGVAAADPPAVQTLAPPPQEPEQKSEYEAEARAKAERYYQQLILEKKKESQASSANGSGAG